MAKQLTDFQPPFRADYPWHEWLDGKSTYELTHGEDFQSNPLTMDKYIRRVASDKGLSVSVYHKPPKKKGDKHVLILRNNGKLPP